LRHHASPFRLRVARPFSDTYFNDKQPTACEPTARAKGGRLDLLEINLRSPRMIGMGLRKVRVSQGA